MDDIINKSEPEAIVIQADPSPMMHYQRQIVINNKEGKSLLEKNISLPYPLNISEVTLDIDKINMFQSVKMGKLIPADDFVIASDMNDELEYKKNFKNINKFLDEFITTEGVHSNINPGLKYALNRSIAENVPVYLAQMPEVILRMIIARKFKLEQLKGMVKNTLESYKEGIVKDLGEVFSRKYPDLKYLTLNLYMNSLIREMTLVYKKNLLAIMEFPYIPLLIKELKEVPRNQLPDFDSFLGLPFKIENESHEELIEKHAILDVIYDTKLWKEPYITNIFMYIDTNKSAILKNDWEFYKETYTKHYLYYSKIINDVKEQMKTIHQNKPHVV